MVKKSKKTSSVEDMKYPKIAGYLALGVYMVGIFSRSLGTTFAMNNGPGDADAVQLYDAVSTWAAYIFVLLGFYVAMSLKWRYWPFRSTYKIAKMDERQKEMRNKVIDWSYRSFGVWALISLMFGNMESMFSRGYVIWMLIGLFFFMPSLVAVHRKGA